MTDEKHSIMTYYWLNLVFCLGWGGDFNISFGRQPNKSTRFFITFCATHNLNNTNKILGLNTNYAKLVVKIRWRIPLLVWREFTWALINHIEHFFICRGPGNTGLKWYLKLNQLCDFIIINDWYLENDGLLFYFIWKWSICFKRI